MKTKLFIISFFFFYFLTSTLTLHAEITNHIFSRETVRFKGENKYWIVDFREYLIGTEIKLETIITYKGDMDKTTSSSRIHTFISDNQFGTVPFEFRLNRLGIYHEKNRDCYGCQLLNNQVYINAEIHWHNKISNLILKRVKSKVNE